MAAQGAGGAVQKVIDTNKIYYASAEERRALEERSKMRENLRKDFQKKITNPYRGVGGYIFDPAVQRFLSMKAAHYEQFKPTVKNAAFVFCCTVLPMGILAYRIDRDRKNREAVIRRGEVAYKDRNWKYI